MEAAAIARPHVPPEFLSLLRVVLRHSETVLRSYSSCGIADRFLASTLN